MSVISDTRDWLASEKPDADEIKQTIDNFAHQFISAGPQLRRELDEAIGLLCSQIQLDRGTVVLPEIGSPAAADALDLGPLGGMDFAKNEAALSEREKLERFNALFEELARPF